MHIRGGWVFVLLFSGATFGQGTTPFFYSSSQTKVGNYLEAAGILEATDETGWGAEDRYKKYVSLGLLYQKTQNYGKSELWLTKALGEGGSSLHSYINYGLGHNHYKLGNEKTSIRFLKKVFRSNVPSYLENLARLDLAELAIKSKSWKRARRYLVKLKRAWRNTPRAPMIASMLLTVNLKLGRSTSACRNVKKLYKKYPTYKTVDSWTLGSRTVKWEGRRLGCRLSANDKIQRVKRLIWLGESKRAQDEVNLLLSQSSAKNNFSNDSIAVERLVREGQLDAAIDIVMKYYANSQKNIDYWLLLAKVLGRARHFKSSVGAYMKAYRLAPRSTKGRKALFYAAFLSYQSGDYDGAQGKFSQLVKGSFRSKLNRDALWYLAWISYLKKDFEGAINRFEILAQKIRKRRGRWWNLPLERVNYWLGVAYLKKGDQIRAIETLNELAKDPLLGYYSLAAKHRLNSLPENIKIQIKTVSPTSPLRGTLDHLMDPAFFLRPIAPPEFVLPKIVSIEAVAREPAAIVKETSILPSQSLQSAARQDGLSLHQNSLQGRYLPPPMWEKRWGRIQNLLEIGFDGWARWELYAVERRTKGPEILRQIMETYHSIEAYHRSTHIAEVYFASARKAMGGQGTYLWEMAFPLAFKSDVNKFAGKFGVNKYFMYSIMKAESRFKKDVVSPVGAKGLMQIMPYTGLQLARLLGDQDFEVAELIRPEVNIRLGTRYLHRLLKKFDKQIPLAAAAYNAGPHRVNSWVNSFGYLDMDEFIEHIPFGETRKYVKRVAKYFAIYQSIYGNLPANEAQGNVISPIQLTSGLALASTVSSKAITGHHFRESWEPLKPTATKNK